MRILLCSHVFPPSIGGIETVSRILAEEFCRLGAAVTVVTRTPGEEINQPYKVVRRPSIGKLLALARSAEIVFQSNISLRTLLPLFFLPRPIVIAHHGRIARVDGSRGWQDTLKRALLFRCSHISISNMIAADLPIESKVIADPFEASEFTDSGTGERDKDFVFLGRLVSDKGCDLALRALAILKQEGLRPSFTVIGDGPEMPALKRLTAELGLMEQVDFLGALCEGRGRIVASHRIMVVPSIWQEPFGVVALEGIAAGCAVIASQGGGLPEAVGPCGILFPNGDVAALAFAMKRLLTSPTLREQLIARRGQHLEEFQPEVVAKRYLEVFESALQKPKRARQKIRNGEA
ncbi:MAG: glycosyltransferase family 4 protein [Terracidiphilus sp.]